MRAALSSAALRFFALQDLQGIFRCALKPWPVVQLRWTTETHNKMRSFPSENKAYGLDNYEHVQKDAELPCN